jgi:hypothetical protein
VSTTNAMMRSVRSALLIGIAILGGCPASPGDTGPIGGSVRVEGRIVDLATGQPVAGTPIVTTSGLAESPVVEVQAPTFALDGIPDNSVFHVQVSVPPSHHLTSSPLEVKTSDVNGVEVSAVAEQLLSQVASSFGVTPSAMHGVLFAQVVDDAGQPRAGVTASSFVVDGGAATKGPFFLDANLAPALGATMTSASGWVVYFDLAAGVIGMRAAPTANVTLDMPVSPISAEVVTVARVRTTDGKFEPPKDVSYLNQVFPIFKKRGCEACHAAGNGPGRQQGDLTLNSDSALVYRELTIERPGRVVPTAPDTSLLLTMPSREEPPDRHPNVTFTSTFDPDYQLIRAWIAEGALQN